MSITDTPTLRWYQRPYLIGVLCGVVGIGAGAAVVAATPTEPMTSPACLEALDEADRLILVGADAMGIFSEVISGPVPDALEAAFAWDADGLDAATAELETYTAQISALDGGSATYGELSEACRMAGK